MDMQKCIIKEYTISQQTSQSTYNVTFTGDITMWCNPNLTVCFFCEKKKNQSSDCSRSSDGQQ